MEMRALTVRQLNFYVKSLLEGDVHLQSIAVTGEISNFKHQFTSGHLYFSLKDADAAIRCVMFRSYAAHLSFQPENVKQVVLIDRISLYEKDGQYQLYAEQMLLAGKGRIAMQFQQIKEKLEKEGLFAPERKRKLPTFPMRIGVVTSKTGAAVQDILSILERRWALAEVILCPASVQGETAVPELTAALNRLFCIPNVDVIIIGRGGGSAEDLQVFNDETLARKIASSPVPVISAVGHETDFSIADFAADLRAPTPSAAAELAVPDWTELIALLDKNDSVMKNALTSCYQYNAARFRAATASPALQKPIAFFLDCRLEQVDRAIEKAVKQLQTKLSQQETDFATLAAKLDSLSPLKVMARGYAAVKKAEKPITSAYGLQKGDSMDLTFADGEVSAFVTDVKGRVEYE